MRQLTKEECKQALAMYPKKTTREIANIFAVRETIIRAMVFRHEHAQQRERGRPLVQQFRNSNRYSTEAITGAIEDLDNGATIRQAATKHRIATCTLRRRYKTHKTLRMKQSKL